MYSSILSCFPFPSLIWVLPVFQPMISIFRLMISNTFITFSRDNRQIRLFLCEDIYRLLNTFKKVFLAIILYNLRVIDNLCGDNLSYTGDNTAELSMSNHYLYNIEKIMVANFYCSFNN